MPPLLLGNIRPFGKTYQALRDLIMPISADQPESIPWVLFDTQQYAAAGSATLSFFRSTAANLNDQTLSNFPTGMLPKNEFFEMHRVFVMIHSVPNINVTGVITGAAQDVEILHKTARGQVSWTNAAKNYGTFPLFFFGRPGGPLPFYAGVATGTVATNVVTAGQTENNGGFPVLGNQIIPEQQPFSAQLTFNSTAISAATNITLAIMGIYHRQVR
ncbi:MAG: hypothetical protein ABJF01_17545 [bacterium]